MDRQQAVQERQIGGTGEKLSDCYKAGNKPA
jgi:hypothetical protein